MPRAAAFKVQGAPRQTRWTLAQSQQEQALASLKTLDLDLDLVSAADVDVMPGADSYYSDHEPPLPRYESYDGCQYSLPPGGLDSQTNSREWRLTSRGLAQVNGHNGISMNGINGHSHGYEDFDFTPLEETASHQISINTALRSQNQDAVGQHLLYETAMHDTQAFEILDIAEVDALKKEQTRLDGRIEAANRKLALESKVKDAAQNLQRLYSVNEKSRPDTPQSPDSPKRNGGRSSLLHSRGRTSSSGSGVGQPLHQAKDELAISIKKVDELNDTIKGLLERRQFVESRLLRHTAAVLAEQSARAAQQEQEQRPLTNGHGNHDEHDANRSSTMYSPDEFDGIRDILNGAPVSSSSKTRTMASARKLQQEHEQQMASVQSRLEQLNDELRHVIDEAGRVRGIQYQPDEQEVDFDEDATVRLTKRLDKLEDNVHLLSREQEETKAHYARVQDSAHLTRNAVEEQLEGINRQCHNILLLGSDMLEMEAIRSEPPEATGHGYQQQLQYLSDSLQAMERLLQQQRAELDSAREASDGASKDVEGVKAKAEGHAQKVGEYEATLGGLWEILQSDVVSRRPSTMSADPDAEDGGLRSPTTPLKEDFSLQAFSARVQHVFNRAEGAKEQQDILKRQIQQQRELNGKSDAEKDRQITDLQTRHDQMAGEYSAAQEELARVMAEHQQVQGQANERELELMNVGNEIEGFKRTIETRHQEHQQAREEMGRQLRAHQEHAEGMQERVMELEAQLNEMTDELRIAGTEAQAKHQQLGEQLQNVNAAKDETEAARQAAEQRHSELQKEMEHLESEVVRLSMELTEAKATLEGAQGSRSERAKGAQAEQLTEQLQKLQADHDNVRGLHDALSSEHDSLRNTHQATVAEMEALRSRPVVNPDRLKNLEAELQDMTDAFQELTRESIELEKERGQLEDLIDGLRDRCETLETQVADERVRLLGMKSPSNLSENGAVKEREQTSVMVMRNEFKKMMREARAEGMKLIRAEQERNRQLSTQLRELRQSNGPLAAAARNGDGKGSAAAPRVPSPARAFTS